MTGKLCHFAVFCASSLTNHHKQNLFYDSTENSNWAFQNKICTLMHLAKRSLVSVGQKMFEKDSSLKPWIVYPFIYLLRIWDYLVGFWGGPKLWGQCESPEPLDYKATLIPLGLEYYWTKNVLRRLVPLGLKKNENTRMAYIGNIKTLCLRQSFTTTEFVCLKRIPLQIWMELGYTATQSSQSRTHHAKQVTTWKLGTGVIMDGCMWVAHPGPKDFPIFLK